MGIRFTRCPKSMIDATTWTAIQLADHADKGAWPVAGGVLDQCESFCRACRLIWSEDARWKAEKKLI